jgi:small subunit ribosomal protein S9
MAERKYYYGLGKRKTAIAKVRLYEKGKGEITVNEKTVSEFFPIPSLVETLSAPLKVTGNEKAFDVTVVTVGGGINGQAEAVQLGIARALLVFDAELKTVMKKEGFLTRDSREKERKKPGLKRARRAPQWSKR